MNLTGTVFDISQLQNRSGGDVLEASAQLPPKDWCEDLPFIGKGEEQPYALGAAFCFEYQRAGGFPLL